MHISARNISNKSFLLFEKAFEKLLVLNFSATIIAKLEIYKVIDLLDPPTLLYHWSEAFSKAFYNKAFIKKLSLCMLLNKQSKRPVTIVFSKT